MSQTPSTPVKVPSSAANYSPATLDPDLRSQINTILLRDGHVPKYVPPVLLPISRSKPANAFFFLQSLRIQDRLLHALNADSSNWPTAIQEHALELLRSGEVLTFPALLKRVVDDIQEASSSSSSSSSSSAANANGNAATTNGNNSSNSKPATNGVNGSSSAPSPSKGGNEKGSLAVPQDVVDETLRVTRECLENVCEITDQPGQ